MALEPPLLSTQLIGETAGLVWGTLAEQGPVSMTRLLNTVNAPRDLVLLAVGWLAREGKLVFEGNARKRTVGLAPS